MDVREKLVELQSIITCPNAICNFCEHFKNKDACEKHKKEVIADYLLDSGVTVQEWISVKDRLPPYNHDVLVYRPNMASKILVDCYVGYYGEDDGEWYEGWARYGKDIHNKPLITHWAEMPQPPKGE